MGLVCGVILALVNFLRILIFFPGQQMVGIVVALSMCFTVIAAKMIGCLLPLGAQRIGIDPAIMASPLITTMVDTMSLIVYFEFASNLLHI